jgi:hypothetical protein
MDRHLVVLCRPPFSFTPRQVREDFTYRDLELFMLCWDEED